MNKVSPSKHSVKSEHPVLDLGGLVEAIVDRLTDRLADSASQSANQESERPRLVKSTGLASALSVSKATITRMCRSGCPHVRVGTERRFDVAEVIAWLKNRERDSSQEVAHES